MSADMGNDAVLPINEWRRGRSVLRQHGGRRHSPDELAAREIERGQDAADPEREDAAAGNGRSGLRAGAVRPRGRIDDVWRRIRRAPDLLARRHIEGADNLFIALTGDHHDPIAGHHRRGMPGADRDLPAFLQRFRPLGGQCGENGTIATRAAPLWPVSAGCGARLWPAPDGSARGQHGPISAWDASMSGLDLQISAGSRATSAPAGSSAYPADPAAPERHRSPFPGRRAGTRRMGPRGSWKRVSDRAMRGASGLLPGFTISLSPSRRKVAVNPDAAVYSPT